MYIEIAIYVIATVIPKKKSPKKASIAFQTRTAALSQEMGSCV